MQSDPSDLGAAAVEESIAMHRSTSMPVKPKPLEQKPLLRSSEKETVNAADYYPESPGFVRRRKSKASPGDQLETRSEQNFPCTHDWAGSTIELTPDVGTSSSEGMRRTLHRVMEKNGKENVVFRRIPEKSWRYMRDLVTTLVRSMFGHKKPPQSVPNTDDMSGLDVYKITPSIQRKLDELANEPPHHNHHLLKPNPGQGEPVTFSI